MKKLVLVTLLAAVVATIGLVVVQAETASAEKSRELLTSRIDYWFVGGAGTTDDEGRRLVWDATISGDFTGTAKWWFGPSPAPAIQYDGARVAYYQARWEIWSDEAVPELLLAGESAGKTVTPDGEDGWWDGHGVVTEASKEFNNLKGRHVSETGPVVWTSDPWDGTGIFAIY